MLLDEERRDFKRLSTVTPMNVTRLSSGEVLAAELFDLSASGCAFLTDLPIEPDEALEILIPSPHERLDPLRRAAHVVRVTDEARVRRVAVQFLSDPA